MGWFTVEASVEIDAPRAKVWDVLTNIDAYPEWNPYVLGVESTLEVGDPVTLTVKQGDETMDVPEVMHTNDGKSVLAWTFAGMPGWAMGATRYQILTPLDDNRTRYDTHESFRGLAAPFIMLTQRDNIQHGFRAMADALKQRAEALA